MRVVAYAYEADLHCVACALGRFGERLDERATVDREGNPIGVVFSTDEVPEGGIYCGDCGECLSD